MFRGIAGLLRLERKNKVGPGGLNLLGLLFILPISAIGGLSR